MMRPIRRAYRPRTCMVPMRQDMGGGGASGPVQLFDFNGAGATFHRNNGSGASVGGSYRTSATTFADEATEVLRTETIGGVARYLFEGTVRNECTRSDELNSLGVSASITVTANTTDVLDPLGTNTAEKCAFGGSNSGHSISQSYTNPATIPPNTKLCFSLWTRGAVGGETKRLGIRNCANVTTYQNKAQTTSWVRQDYPLDVGAGATAVGCFFQESSPAVAETLYAIGFQVERGTYPTSRVKTSVVAGYRYADVELLAPSEVPPYLISGNWTTNVRPLFANADLSDGDVRVLVSTDANNWIGFEKSGGSLYLRCYVGGVLMFGTGAITVARDTDYAIRCNLAGGVMTFDGVAGSTGTAAALPAGVLVRIGGTAGGGNELSGGIGEIIGAAA